MERGIESLKAAVKADCEKGNNCFSENGCTHERYKILPQDNPGLIEMGHKTRCVANTKCFHDYCGKYKWVMERAQHYAEKTGKTAEEVIKIWETARTYWYMNYYQESNQPLLTSEYIIDFDDWIKDLKDFFGEDPKDWAFKCPVCGNIQTAKDFIKHNIEEPENKVYFSCIGRYVKGIGCDWTLGGLLKINKISVMKDAQVFPVFQRATLVDLLKNNINLQNQKSKEAAE